MSAEDRRRHKAHLDQHIRDAQGEYHYVGDWYAVSGGWRALLPFAVWSVLTTGAVIAAGCVDFPGLRNTWYVILPYLAAICALFAFWWNAGRILSGGGRLKTFAWEKSKDLIAPLAGLMIGFLALLCVTSGIYLIRHESTHAVAFYALLLLGVVSAVFSLRSFKAQEWEKA